MIRVKSTRNYGWSLASRLMKSDDFHYGFWEDGLEVSVANLPKAQDAYTEFLIGKIPPGVKTILDVGCGKGKFAELLMKRGYEVEAVSPAPMLTEFARKRLGPDFKIYETTFEALETERRYDLTLFSESFQFINPADSLPKAHSVLNPGGYALICDFFKTDAPGESAMGGGHRLSRFYEILAAQPFEVVLDQDITRQTAPNIQLVHELLRDYVIPIWETLAAYIRDNYRFLAWVGRKLLRERIEKIERKYLSGKRDAADFALHKSYRCLLLRKKD